MRAPFQVLIFPYRKKNGIFQFGIFKRDDLDVWQGIAGGGEEGETKLEAAKREAFEEAGIPMDFDYIVLDSMTMIPVEYVTGNFYWGDEVLVIPEYSFGVDVKDYDIKISDEHKEFKWVSYEEAVRLLNWDSNKTAIWELFHRISKVNSVANF